MTPSSGTSTTGAEDRAAISAAPSRVASALPVVKPKFMKAMAFGNLAGGKLSASKE